MQRRTLLSLVNLGVAAVAVAIVFVLPQYATLAVYAFLGWFVVSLAVVWGSRGSRPVGAPAALSSSPSPAGPLAASGPPTAGPAGPISFCAYCAADLPAGATRCPACRHAVLALA